MDSLYIQVHTLNGDDDIGFDIDSYIVLSLIKYLKIKDLMKVQLIYNYNVPKNKVLVKLDDAVLSSSHKILDPSECLWSVKQCRLPVITSRSGILIHSGLCSILRHLVLTAYQHLQDKVILSLLGFKQGCLKACAEVSHWTQFCEVEFPKAVEEFLQILLTEENENISIPETLLKLERHIEDPPSVYNAGKAKKDWDKKIEDHQIKELHLNDKLQSNPAILCEKFHNLKLLSTTQKLSTVPVLEENTTQKKLLYPFLEGYKVTLTDVVLFWCMDLIEVYLGSCTEDLTKLLPHTDRWLNNVITYCETLSRFDVIEIVAQDCDKSMNARRRINFLQSNEYSRINIRTRRTRNNHSKSDTRNVESLVKNLKDSGTVLESVPHPAGNVQLDWDAMPASVHPAQGSLGKRVDKKCQQLENMVAAVKMIAKPGDVIVDFCSGGGHLGIVLSHVLPECKILLVENKERSIILGMERIEKMKATNITQYQCNLDFFNGEFDIGVCLHGCGMVTDLVLQSCYRKQANFVVCPCCYGAIQNTDNIRYPRSEKYKELGILNVEYLTLSHTSDQTQEIMNTLERGNYCMNIIDTDRLLEARTLGYNVCLTKLTPNTCSPKNNLMIGTMGLTRNT